MITRKFGKDHKVKNLTSISDETDNRNLTDTEKELQLEDLAKKAGKQFRDSFSFLDTNPNDLPTATYVGTKFAHGRLPDHGSSQYLFKLACQVVDKKWDELRDV